MEMRLVVAEKEDAAERIAAFLGCQRRDVTVEGWKGTFWESDVDLVVAARGHLYELWLRGLRVNSIEKLPVEETYHRVRKENRPRVEMIKMLSERCDSVVVATDFDREGEVIGYNIVKYLRGIEEPSQLPRAYFSALTESELSRAFNEIVPMDEALLTQGLARNLADTIVGLNITKALTILFKNRFSRLSQGVSIGRVQSPLLSYIVRNVGVEYPTKGEAWVDKVQTSKVYIETEEGDVEVEVEPPTSGEVELIGYDEEEREVQQAERFPNTSTFQSELPFNPEVSMSICQSMYGKAWLSYPRTKSHYLPREVIEGLEMKMKEHDFLPDSFGAENARVEVEEAKLPHWAVVLTEEGVEALADGLIRGREKIVARYFIAKMAKAMAPPLRVKTKYAKLIVDDEEVRLKWREECENPEDAVSYQVFYGKPEVEVGKYRVKVVKPLKEDTWITTYAFNPSFKVFDNKSLVSWMEGCGLGTEATRHTFPVKLQRRNYLDGENLPNQLGETVATVIEKLGLSPQLTAEMEMRIERLNRLEDLEEFKEWIVNVTNDMLERLKAGVDVQFTCPKLHESELVNTKYGLLMYCDECAQFYRL